LGVGGFRFSFRFKFLGKFVNARVYFRGAFARSEVLDFSPDVRRDLSRILDLVGAPFSGACRDVNAGLNPDINAGMPHGDQFLR
jgi:hypothetical protein